MRFKCFSYDNTQRFDYKSTNRKQLKPSEKNKRHSRNIYLLALMHYNIKYKINVYHHVYSIIYTLYLPVLLIQGPKVLYRQPLKFVTDIDRFRSL
jgi:hypothetical protein